MVSSYDRSSRPSRRPPGRQLPAEPLFKRIGGHVALDFVNTVAGRTGAGAETRAVGNRLRSYPDLIRWAREAGLPVPNAASNGAVPRGVAPRRALARAIRFREALHRTLAALIDDLRPPRADLALIEREIRIARGRQRLAVADGRLVWRTDPSPAPVAVLVPLVLETAELLTSTSLDRLRRCPGERCGWLFLDTTRNRRRQWCDMADCGTLAKVRRFRARRRAARSGRGRPQGSPH